MVLGLHIPDADRPLFFTVPDALGIAVLLNFEAADGGGDLLAVAVVFQGGGAIHGGHGLAATHPVIVGDGSGDLLNPDAGLSDAGDDVPGIQGHGVTPGTTQDLAGGELLQFLDGLLSGCGGHSFER